MEITISKRVFRISIISIVAVLVLFVIVNALPKGILPAMPSNINLGAIFLTGLLTGGLTCLAVQGGLLAATIAQREEEKLTEKTKQSGNALPILTFLTTKLIAYTALGFLLGWFGSLFQLSLTAQIVMQLVVTLFMIATALNILNVHPIFRYVVIQPPKFITRLVRNQSKSKSLFAPALLGAFTIFIPCGTTQAMMALSIGSGNPLIGAAVLFSFILGTSPLFFTLGYFATKLGESLHKKFMKIAAIALLLLALFNINNMLALTGSTWTFTNLFPSSEKTKNSMSVTTDNKNLMIAITENGYSPNVLTAKAGTKVNLTIKNTGVYSCASSFTIPAFNYQKVVQKGKPETIALTMPDKPTQIPFMCSMGMYRGVINVL